MASDKSSRGESGFSLLEVVVSVFLLAVVSLGIAQLFALAAHATLNSKSQTSTAVLAIQKMEQLRSLTWGYQEGPGGTTGQPVTDTTTDLSVDSPSSGGTGLAPSPATALEQDTPPFVDYLDANGRWIGNGGTPPRQTVFVRRWSIEPLPNSSNETFVFQVLVTTLQRENQRSRAGPRGRLLEDTRLASVKTRKGL